MSANDAPRTLAAEHTTPGQHFALIVLADHGPCPTGDNTCRAYTKAQAGIEIAAKVNRHIAAQLMRSGLAEDLPGGYVQITDAGRQLLQETH